MNAYSYKYIGLSYDHMIQKSFIKSITVRIDHPENKLLSIYFLQNLKSFDPDIKRIITQNDESLIY